MPRDKTMNHIRLMAAAREEFLEYGFEKASMRSIGKRCGLTAAGIYRHCRDKEDLFDQLVAPSAEKLNTWLEEHVARYVDMVEKNREPRWHDSWIDMMREVVYPHLDDYHLLLTCASGTKYENFLHDYAEENGQALADAIRFMKEQGYPAQILDKEELHMLLSAYLTAVFEPIIHGLEDERIEKSLTRVNDFFMPGWKNIRIGLKY